MTNDDIALAARAILDGKGKPVTLFVRRIPFGHYNRVEVTTQIPTGRFRFANVCAGNYTTDITLRELTLDLRQAERELREQSIHIDEGIAA
jgi:hypothetical protein